MSAAEKLGLISSKTSMSLFGDEPPLIRLGVRITPYCNLHCPYCSADASLLQFQEIPVSGAINTHLFESALKQATNLGSVVLELTGGEPFLYRDLLKVLKYADDLGYITIVATNGTLIEKHAAKMLAKLEGLDNLQITLDGSRPEIHDSTRGRGTFTKIVNTVKMLRYFNVPVVINTVVNKQNLHDIENIASLSKELGAIAYKTSIMSCFGRGEYANKKIGLGLEDIVKLVQRIHLLFQTYKGKMKVSMTVPLCLMPKDLRYDLLDISACNVLILAGLDWNGDVGPCVYYLGLDKRYKIGDLKRQRLEELWTSNEFKLFRKKFINAWKLLETKVPCSVCICKDDCYGICPAMAFQKAEKMVIPGDLCRRLYKEKSYRWIITEGWSSKDS